MATRISCCCGIPGRTDDNAANTCRSPRSPDVIVMFVNQSASSHESVVLGITGGYNLGCDDDPVGCVFHDAAAVLLRNGEVLAAIEEERISRIKHSNCFPYHAIRDCLRETGTQWPEINVIALNTASYVADALEKASYFEDPRHTPYGDGRQRLAMLFDWTFGVDVKARLAFCNHHLAHAWSTFAPSGFDESLIVCLDGDGDFASGAVFTGKNKTITKLREYPEDCSLGHLYFTLIHMLGYSIFDEYKAMGLAPYGDASRYESVLSKCYRLLPNGGYALDDKKSWLLQLNAAGLLAQARRSGQPFSQTHKDFAASLQQVLERIVFHILAHYKQQTKQRYLCLAGGVAHNCTLNGKILASGLFEKVYVQPAAHDAGGALGAAWWAWHSHAGGAKHVSLSHVFLGKDVGSDDTIRHRLQRWAPFIECVQVQDPPAETARLLAEGYVVAWVQGRSEFGPRALGNRSILADPRPAGNKDLINRMVKKREQFRPFAPSVLIEHVADYFDVPAHQHDLAFMVFVVGVKEDKRQHLGAITHVDGTARIQTVSYDDNPRYWRLIDEFRKLTGMPIVLNTSFNNNAEPIVDSVDDAITCFLTTHIHYAVVGSFLISRRESPNHPAELMLMTPEIPSWRKLVKKQQWTAVAGNKTVYQIASTKSRDFGPQAVEITEAMFQMLQRADGSRTLGELVEQPGALRYGHYAQFMAELEQLWAMRLVALKPRFLEEARDDTSGRRSRDVVNTKETADALTS